MYLLLTGNGKGQFGAGRSIQHWSGSPATGVYDPISEEIMVGAVEGPVARPYGTDDPDVILQLSPVDELAEFGVQLLNYTYSE